MSRNDDQGPPPDETPGAPIAAGAWDALTPELPPADFAARVLAARAAEAKRGLVDGPVERPVVPRRGPWRRATLYGIVACAAATVAIFLATSRGGTAAGRLDALARTSVRLGARGVAVAEPGARVDWRVTSGAAAVTQTRGDVFYRVERGGAFVVTTPAGEVEVKGTCFRVRLEEAPMKGDTIKGAVAGAVLATVAVVTVYEGVVKVRAQGRDVTVPAGQAAKVIAGDAPRMVPGDAPGVEPVQVAVEASPAATATREELLARDQRHRDQIAALTVRLGRMEADLRAAGGPGGGPRGGRDERKFFDIPPDELKEMAAHCEIRYALPSFGLDAPTVPSKAADKLGLSAAQRSETDAFLKETNDAFVKEVRALYVEATGDAAGAETLELQAMMTEIENKSGVEGDMTRKKIAEERAGLRPPGDARTGTPHERLLRVLLAVSEATHRRALALGGKEASDAMMSHRSVMSGCGDER